MAASFGIEFPDGIMDGLIEVVRSGEGLVGEVMPLQVAPETLDIVQLRSGFRQPLDREPVGPRGEGAARRLAGVDRTVIEDQNEWVVCRGLWYSSAVILVTRGVPCRATGKIPFARSPLPSGLS